MIKILFICHGNICRSPMAQMMLTQKVNDLKMNNQFFIESKACSSEEIGNGIYYAAKNTLIKHNINLIPHYASKFTKEDYYNYDYILCMDDSNIRLLNIICPDVSNKYQLLLDYTKDKGEVSDPWYTRNFEICYNDIEKGINGFLSYLKENKKI